MCICVSVFFFLLSFVWLPSVHFSTVSIDLCVYFIIVFNFYFSIQREKNTQFFLRCCFYFAAARSATGLIHWKMNDDDSSCSFDIDVTPHWIKKHESKNFTFVGVVFSSALSPFDIDRTYVNMKNVFCCWCFFLFGVLHWFFTLRDRGPRALHMRIDCTLREHVVHLQPTLLCFLRASIECLLLQHGLVACVLFSLKGQNKTKTKELRRKKQQNQRLEMQISLRVQRAHTHFYILYLLCIHNVRHSVGHVELYTYTRRERPREIFIHSRCMSRHSVLHSHSSSFG